MLRAVAVAAMQRQLVERAQQGDHDAFADLAKASHARMYSVARLILRDSDRAKDAVQDALVQAWRHMRAIRDPDAWDIWLHRTTVRACYKVAKKERRRRLHEFDVLPDFASPSATDVAAEFAERDRLERELDRLDIDRRAVIVGSVPPSGGK
jgi:DNA-directed RNA polymerase specialized sigma24 family protein